jgi:hypothetical protein
LEITGTGGPADRTEERGIYIEEEQASQGLVDLQTEQKREDRHRGRTGHHASSHKALL